MKKAKHYVFNWKFPKSKQTLKENWQKKRRKWKTSGMLCTLGV